MQYLRRMSMVWSLYSWQPLTRCHQQFGILAPVCLALSQNRSAFSIKQCCNISVQLRRVDLVALHRVSPGTSSSLRHKPSILFYSPLRSEVPYVYWQNLHIQGPPLSLSNFLDPYAWFWVSTRKNQALQSSIRPLIVEKNSNKDNFPKPSINPPIFWNTSSLITNGPCTILQVCTSVSVVSVSLSESSLRDFCSVRFFTWSVFLMWTLHIFFTKRHQDWSNMKFPEAFISWPPCCCIKVAPWNCFLERRKNINVCLCPPVHDQFPALWLKRAKSTGREYCYLPHWNKTDPNEWQPLNLSERATHLN